MAKHVPPVSRGGVIVAISPFTPNLFGKLALFQPFGASCCHSSVCAAVRREHVARWCLLVVWSFGCLVVWSFGRLVVGLLGCLVNGRLAVHPRLVVGAQQLLLVRIVTSFVLS